MEYGLDLSLEQLSRLGPDEQLPFLWHHAMRLELIESDVPMHVAHEVLDDLKRIFHHHMVLTDRYAVRPYPGRITLIRPNDAPVAVSARRDKGWGRLAPEVDVHFVPGQHHSMVKEPFVQELARVLDECLRRAKDVPGSMSQMKV
jgi:thioesterase domain-containing protein